MGCAEVISLDEVRARTHWTTLRQRLHERFDRWLDQLEAALPEGAPTLGQVSETVWALRQQLTGGVAETIVHHTHPEEQHRPYRPCPVHACCPPAARCIAASRPWWGLSNWSGPTSIVRSAVRGPIHSTRRWT